jgi:TonB family protein
MLTEVRAVRTFVPMSTAIRATIGASMLVSSTLAAQGSRADSRPLQIDTLVGDISATLPSGATLRGAGATVYLWVDSPEFRKTLESACIAEHAQPNAWLAARTELEMPSETPLDSTAAEDLAILRQVVADPHAIAQADSSGRFRFVAVPAGTYWIEAESMQGSAIVQWWDRLSMEPADFALVRILGKRDMIFSVSLATKNFTHDQFCTGGETPIGATEFAEGIPTPEMVSPAPDRAYRHVDQPASIIDEHLQPTYPEALRKRGESGSVDVRFVIDSTGRIDMRTVRVIRSTDPEFTDAVLRVLPMARFNPALVGGHPVRWATAQQFNFGINAPQFRSLP